MNGLSDPTKQRWLGFAALAAVFLLVSLHRLSTAVLSEDLTAAFDTTATQLGTLHAAFFYIYAAIQIPTGVMADRYGPRYVGSIGAGVLSLGAIAFAVADTYLAAFLARILLGAGSGVIFITTLRFCANWYRADEFATMTGVIAAIGGLGAIFATVPLALAVGALGWRIPVFALGAVGFVSAAGVYVFARKSPESAGLQPIDNVPEQPSVTLRETGTYLRQLVGDPQQWLLSFIFFAVSGTMLTIIGLWGIPYLVTVYGLDVTTASYYTLLGSVGTVVGAPIIGRISDTFGRRLVPMSTTLDLFTVVLAIIPLFGKPPLFTIAISYFLYGFLLGGAFLGMVLIKERYPPNASGIATATVNTAGFIGGALFPTIMGLALDTYRTGEVVVGTPVYTEFGYRVAFGILTVALASAFLCSVWLFFKSNAP